MTEKRFDHPARFPAQQSNNQESVENSLSSPLMPAHCERTG